MYHHLEIESSSSGCINIQLILCRKQSVAITKTNWLLFREMMSGSKKIVIVF